MDLKVFSGNELFEGTEISELESILEDMTYSSAKIGLIGIKEKGQFGSLRSQALTRKASQEVKRANSEGYYAMLALDGDSRYAQQPAKEEFKEAIKRRLDYSGPHIGKLLASLKLQQTSAEGSLVALSNAEDMVYHLQTTNNHNLLGFPGAWMLYFSQENGFYVQKVEPILIIPSCLVCPHGMIENLLTNGEDMNMAEERIVDELQAGDRKRYKNRPSDCPNTECRLLFSHNNYGAVYNNRFFSITQTLSLDQHRLSLENVPRGHPEGLRIAKLIGQLRNPFYKSERFY